MKYLEVHKKRPMTPIFDDRYGIRDKFIFQAKRLKRMMKIYSVKGIIYVSPDYILKNTLYTRPMWRKNPDKPMILHYVDLPVSEFQGERPRVLYDTLPNEEPPTMEDYLRARLRLNDIRKSLGILK